MHFSFKAFAFLRAKTKERKFYKPRGQWRFFFFSAWRLSKQSGFPLVPTESPYKTQQSTALPVVDTPLGPSSVFAHTVSGCSIVHFHQKTEQSCHFGDSWVKRSWRNRPRTISDRRYVVLCTSFESLNPVYIALMLLKLGPLLRGSAGLTFESCLWQKDAEATKGHPTGPIRE